MFFNFLLFIYLLLINFIFYILFFFLGKRKKNTGVISVSPRWDYSPLQGPPPPPLQQYQFLHLHVERHCESSVACPKTQKITLVTEQTTWTPVSLGLRTHIELIKTGNWSLVSMVLWLSTAGLLSQDNNRPDINFHNFINCRKTNKFN